MLDPRTIAGLNLALDEARLLGADVSEPDRVAALTFSVLTLPEFGPAPKDPRVQVLLRPVGKVVASLRHGSWDDESAAVEPLELSDLLATVEGFRTDIYGNDFIDARADQDLMRRPERQRPPRELG